MPTKPFEKDVDFQNVKGLITSINFSFKQASKSNSDCAVDKYLHNLKNKSYSLYKMLSEMGF